MLRRPGATSAHRGLSVTSDKAARPKLAVAKLIPMAGRTGKLEPVRSSNGGLSLPHILDSVHNSTHPWPSALT